MAFIPVLLSLLVMLFAKEGIGEKIIELGSWLSPQGNHSSWASSSGHFAFGFYPHKNGFAVGIWLVSVSPHDNNTIIWTAKRDSPPFSHNSTLNLTENGLWLFRSGNEGPVHISSHETVTTSACMLDSGNFVLYNDTHHTVVWQSFDEPTDTILGSQNLSSDAKLVSSVSISDHSSGRFFLIIENENLVAYPVNSSASDDDAYWSSNTGDFHKLSLNVSGFRCISRISRISISRISISRDSVVNCPSKSGYRGCIYGVSSSFECFNNSIGPGKKSHNRSSIYRATLEVDGNLILYEHQFEGNGSHSHIQQLWSTSLGKCQVKGICGLNSYCSNVTGHAVCDCFPGFVPSNSSSNVSPDCVLAHSKYGCGSSQDPNPMIFYNITDFENLYWDDDSNVPYSVIPMKKEECKNSFQEDCDCRAVLYSDGNCKKYRLPLTYGRRVQNASMVALFKMTSGFVTSPIPNKSKQEPKVIVDKKKSLIMILAFTLGFISLLSLGFAVSIFLTYKQKVYRYTTLSTNEDLRFTEECSLRSFSFDELEKSTGGFTDEIGKGSFGAVYRGRIGDSNRSIAVKRLERFADEGEREFRTEITTIARTHHRNLVKLIGFCINGSRKLLVYEYVSNGSLASLLFNDEKHISWRERLKIALDVAGGILYLHEECEVRVIHCNINLRNILMDDTWTAKISDFGLARLIKTDLSRMKKEDDGTSKYLAPEWHKDAPVSVKLDIYSFGMVILEIVCRRRSIEMNVSSAEEILLSSWVCQCFAAGQLNKLVKEDEGVDWNILERMVKVGLWCVQDSPPHRPSIKNVILMLEGFKDIPIPPPPAHLTK